MQLQLQHWAQAYSITPIQNVFLLSLMSLKLQSKTLQISHQDYTKLSVKVTGTRQRNLIDLEESCQKHLWIACCEAYILDLLTAHERLPQAFVLSLQRAYIFV